MLKSGIGFAIPVFFLLACAGTLRAQLCDKNIEPDQGTFHYQKRSGDDRCEGTYRKYRGANSLRLISFTAGSISYTTNLNARLEISAPATPYGAEVNVQGNNFNMNTLNSLVSYRLDMTLTEKINKKVIPLQEVINRIPIPPDHLGFFGYVVHNNSQIFVPLIATEQDPNNHYPVTWTSQDYTILLTSETYIDKLSFSLTALGSTPQLVKPYTLLGQNISPDSKLQIVLKDKDIPAGRHNFLLQPKYGSSGTMDIIKYSLFIP